VESIVEDVKVKSHGKSEAVHREEGKSVFLKVPRLRSLVRLDKYSVKVKQWLETRSEGV
jgi:hypothetical protein